MTTRYLATSISICGAIALFVTPATSVAATPKAPKHYVVRNLASDGFIPAEHTDANLVNSWGIAFNPNGFVWVANADAGTSTLYDGDGNPQPLVVTIPTPPGRPDAGGPTGIVFNSSGDFAVAQGVGDPKPSRFIFATEGGTIVGWSPDFGDPTHAVIALDNSAAETKYTGLALGANGTAHFLYAADFRHHKIDVLNASFQAATLPGAFEDTKIPEDFAPFGIHNINGNLYVTYAKIDEEAEDVTGPGLGYVNVFDTNGQFIKRFASKKKLNAPWGIALAPANFGVFSNALLIGNFGDGAINAYDLRTGSFRGRLRDTDNHPIEIEGLWGIAFGNGLQNQPVNTLFFAAGPGDEEHGLYGRINISTEN